MHPKGSLKIREMLMGAKRLTIKSCLSATLEMSEVMQSHAEEILLNSIDELALLGHQVHAESSDESNNLHFKVTVKNTASTVKLTLSV